MPNQIINRVANSSLEIFDLEDFFPKQEIIFFDIKQWLFQEMILKEKDFREQVKNHHWQQYQGKYVAVGCSSEAIVPAWAYLLITSYLLPFCIKVVKGSTEDLLVAIYQETLAGLDYSRLKDKPVIIKGCSRKPVPESVYIQAISYIQPVARSIMYGEACSAVPIFKKSN